MPPIQEPPRALEFLFSEANGYRSREKVVIAGPGVVGSLPPAATRIPLLPGTLLYPMLVAGAPNGYHLPVTIGTQSSDVNAILMYPVDARDGDVEAAVIIRDAEVNDAYLLYAIATTAGTPFTQAEIDAANGALRANSVIVRLGVLAQALANPPIEPTP